MSVTAARGFVAAGGAVGIKAGGRLDVAVVATADGRPVPAAGVFTSNLAAAAPVQVSREHLRRAGGAASAVVLTSGNANAATGARGLDAARQLCSVVAAGVGSGPHQVLVCQTGLIGVPFPTEVLGNVPAVVERRQGGPDAGDAAARAIMTTDTVLKQAVAGPGLAGRSGGAAGQSGSGQSGSGRPAGSAGTSGASGTAGTPGWTVGGMAKGAAMLAPDMATMLAVLTTDAAVDPATLEAILAHAVGSTFNALTVDGCTSTNDTVLLLARGLAGPADPAALAGAAAEVCGSLARQMADDAEGATKTARIAVHGAATDAQAHRAARTVAESLLVKTSLNGADPYWGRVVSELGSAGVAFTMARTSVRYGGIAVCVGGEGAAHDAAAVAHHMAGRFVEIECDLGMGGGRAAVLTTDLGHGYIDENRTTS